MLLQLQKTKGGTKVEDLVESILDYVRADYTDYAIMINGEWGSGKTYFWNHKVKNKIESLRINGKRYTTIYMSLYGISNLEEISKKIFIETTQLMDKNMKRYMSATGQSTIPEYAKPRTRYGKSFWSYTKWR